jgi:hypothetical protein
MSENLLYYGDSLLDQQREVILRNGFAFFSASLERSRMAGLVKVPVTPPMTKLSGRKKATP